MDWSSAIQQTHPQPAQSGWNMGGVHPQPAQPMHPAQASLWDLISRLHPQPAQPIRPWMTQHPMSPWMQQVRPPLFNIHPQPLDLRAIFGGGGLGSHWPIQQLPFLIR